MDQFFHKNQQSQGKFFLQFLLFGIFIIYQTCEFLNIFEVSDLRLILETEMNENARIVLPTFDDFCSKTFQN